MVFSFFIWCHQNSHLGKYWFFGFSTFIRYNITAAKQLYSYKFLVQKYVWCWESSLWVKNIADFWRFWYLNIPCLRRNIAYSSCDFLKRSNKFTHMKDCFWFLAAIFVPLKGTPTIYKDYFFQISCILNFAQTWFLARLFVYSSSFISHILDFLYIWFPFLFFDGVTVKTKNSYNVTTIILL